jgi:hypothetical protein
MDCKNQNGQVKADGIEKCVNVFPQPIAVKGRYIVKQLMGMHNHRDSSGNYYDENEFA